MHLTNILVQIPKPNHHKFMQPRSISEFKHCYLVVTENITTSLKAFSLYWSSKDILVKQRSLQCSPVYKRFFYIILAYRPALWAFRLALQGYSVASLLRASRSHLARFAPSGFALASRSLRLRMFCALRSHLLTSLARCCAHFALCARILLASLVCFLCFALTKIFEKEKCVSIDSKYSETHKNTKKHYFTPLTHYAFCA